MDPTINISDVKWQIADVSHLNPVKINTIIPPQLPAIMNIACYVKDLSDIRIQSTLYIQGRYVCLCHALYFIPKHL